VLPLLSSLLYFQKQRESVEGLDTPENVSDSSTGSIIGVVETLLDRVKVIVVGDKADIF